MTVLDLEDTPRFATFTSAELATYVEAARVMLWTFHSVPPPNTMGNWAHEATRQAVELAWREPSTDDQLAHANEIDATEDAAYALAFAVAHQLGYAIVGRLHHGSGADWIMVLRGEPRNDYTKLEVSGIARTRDSNAPHVRLRIKVKQGSGGDYNRPGIAVVARFEDALILSEGWK